MTKMIGYLRVSTTRQAKEGHGLDAQKNAITQRAEREHWEMRWIDDPAVSGTKSSRPGLNKALMLLDAGEYAGIVASRLDRLARSTLHFAELVKRAEKGGWNIVVLNADIDLKSSTGRLLVNLLASIAEFEHDLIVERTKEGLAAAKEKGILPGPKPSALDVATIDRLLELDAQDARDTAIAHALTVEGYPLPSGVPGIWTPTQVIRLRARVSVAITEPVTT
jgi:DNA invertase Pin-like site-specific DNA recombinase